MATLSEQSVRAREIIADHITAEEHKAKIGNCIARLLMLKTIKRGEQKGRYDTQWGTKTDLGLFNCINRIMTEQRINL